MTLSFHHSLSAIVLGWSSRQHPVSTQNWWKYVFAGLSTLVCPCVGVHSNKLLMSLSLFLQQCPACFVHFTWMFCEMRGKWPYSCCFLEYCFQDLFKTACSIIGLFPFSFLFSNILSESKWCNYTVVLIWLQPRRIPNLPYLRDQISLQLITCLLQSMPFLYVYWRHFL